MDTTPAIPIPPFWNGALFLFAVVAARYFVVAGIPYFLLYVRGGWAHRKIRPQHPPPGIVRQEILWSVVTCALFGLTGSALLQGWQRGWILLYRDPAALGWVWYALSLPVLMGVHEAYFYFSHRLIHHPWLFRRVHLVHHESNNPTPWATFSFHPWEGLLHAVAVPLFLLVIPVHPTILLTYLVVMTVFGVINHLGFELFPAGAPKWLTRGLITSTHHYLHHSRGSGNYGLYFTFFDHLLGTQQKDSDTLFDEVTQRRHAAPQTPSPEKVPNF